MATQSEYLINHTTNDCNRLLTELQAVRTTTTRIVERMKALDTPALAGYVWPEGYTENDFVALYNALKALPGSIVADDVRNQIFKLVSFIQ